MLQTHSICPQLSDFEEHHEAVVFKSCVQLAHASQTVTEKFEKNVQHPKKSSVCKNGSSRKLNYVTMSLRSPASVSASRAAFARCLTTAYFATRKHFGSA